MMSYQSAQQLFSCLGIIVLVTSGILLPISCTRIVAVEATSGQPVATTAIAATPTTSALGIGEWLDPRLRSLKIFGGNAELSDPIIPLDGGYLTLSFDWLDEEIADFRYDIVHCDRNWQPSRISTIDYLQGFQEGDIINFRLSVTTLQPYASYDLMLPNQYVAWKISGNYLLNVYNDSSGKLVARLRFCVFENLLNPDPIPQRPTNAQLDRTHQEFDVSVYTGETRIQEPRRSISLSVLQNGDWRYGIYNMPVRLIRGDDAVWDTPGKIVFPGHREWRGLDLRTLLSVGGVVEEVVQEKNGYTAFLAPQIRRINDPDEVRIDINGKFVLDDFDNRLSGRSDYATTIFTLKSERDTNIEPIYLYGALNGYQISEANRGVYNELTKSYVFRTILRQGFYEYGFVSYPPNAPWPLWDLTEGNTFAAENNYNFLVYYHPYGARYDRIVGYRLYNLDL